MSEDRHSCHGKVWEILRRTNIATNHDEISYICEQLGFSEPGQFWAWMNALSDEELRAEIQRMLERRRKKYAPEQVLETVSYIQ